MEKQLAFPNLGKDFCAGAPCFRGTKLLFIPYNSYLGHFPLYGTCELPGGERNHKYGFPPENR